MDPQNLNINEIIGTLLGLTAGGIGSHWVKMRRDIKAAHRKIRYIERQLKLSNEDDDNEL